MAGAAAAREQNNSENYGIEHGVEAHISKPLAIYLCSTTMYFSIPSSRYSMMLRLSTKNDNKDRNHDDRIYKIETRVWEITLLTTAEQDSYISTADGTVAGGPRRDLDRSP